jgi:hypothetical protein
VVVIGLVILPKKKLLNLALDIKGVVISPLKNLELSLPSKITLVWQHN